MASQKPHFSFPRFIKTLIALRKDTSGDAIVEAAILFPIMIMIFAGLVLLSVYLPTRAALQRATQYTATALSTELSDSWLFYDMGTFEYYWKSDKDSLRNVYSAMFAGMEDAQANAEEITLNADGRLASYKSGEFTAECHVNNLIIYKEVVVTARRIIKAPVDLSFVGFPAVIEITVTSTAVIQDGDEFIRNVDLVVDFADFIAGKLGLDNAGDSIGSLGGRFRSLIGGGS